MSDVEESPTPGHLQVAATRLSVAFSIWAVVVGIAAVAVTTVVSFALSKVADFQKEFTEYSRIAEHRMTSLEEHDKLSDAERQRNTVAIADLQRELERDRAELATHKAGGKQ